MGSRWRVPGKRRGDYDAIYLSGSPHGAYEAIDWISTEHVLIEQAATKGTPMFGVCFGSQILASRPVRAGAGVPAPRTARSAISG